MAWAASSTTATPASVAIRPIVPMSAVCPNRCTGRMTFVAGVIRRWTACRVDVERPRLDVGEDGPGPQPRHGAGGGEEREARQDHLVSGPDPQRHQRQQQGIAPRGAAHSMFGLAILGQVLFQFGDLRSQDESARIADPAECRQDLLLQDGVLSSQVQQRDALDRPILSIFANRGRSHARCSPELWQWPPRTAAAGGRKGGAPYLLLAGGSTADERFAPKGVHPALCVWHGISWKDASDLGR